MANTLEVLQPIIALTVTTKDNDSVDLDFTVTVARCRHSPERQQRV